MKKPYTDVPYEVVGNHYRPGERHRDRKLRRWIYTGRQDAYGRPLWYRPPRLRRPALALALVGAILAARMVWAVLTSS